MDIFAEEAKRAGLVDATKSCSNFDTYYRTANNNLYKTRDDLIKVKLEKRITGSSRVSRNILSQSPHKDHHVSTDMFPTPMKLNKARISRNVTK